MAKILRGGALVDDELLKITKIGGIAASSKHRIACERDHGVEIVRTYFDQGGTGVQPCRLFTESIRLGGICL